MGDPKKLRKKYQTPSHPWRRDVLKEELRLIGEYGLRNKKELWRAASNLRRYRVMARATMGLTENRRREAENSLVGKLHRMGLLRSGSTCDDVLQLTARDFLERRLQTVVFRQGRAKSMYQARQLIGHGRVLVRGAKVTAPGYHVMRGEEDVLDVRQGAVERPKASTEPPRKPEGS